MSGSGTDYTQTLNLGLYKPSANKAVGFWGDLWNSNADAIDAAIHFASGGGPFLPLSGGLMTATITSGAATPATPPILQTVWNVNNSDGVVTTYQCQTDNQTYINNPVGQNVWANRDELFYRSPTPTTTRTSYIASTSHTVAFTARGTAAGAPQIWAHLMEVQDQTGQKSSISGQQLTLEVDASAAGLDDANVRAIIVVAAGTYGYPTVPSSEFATGITVESGDAGAVYKNQLVLAGQFNTAGINFTQSVSIGGAPAIWLSTGQSIAFDSGKNMQFLWNGANSRYEFQWFGSPIWALTGTGDMTVMGGAHLNGGLTFQGGANVAGSIYTDSNWGCLLRGRAGTSADIGLQDSAGTTHLQISTFGMGFHGAPPSAKPTVSGAKGGNVALASLMTALAGCGLVTDSTT